MNRRNFILATLSSKPEHRYSPVQLQKLFFLIDNMLLDELGKTYFNFQPYHYGPFDPEIYGELEDLSAADYIEINKSRHNGFKVYNLTKEGVKKSEGEINKKSRVQR